ncbi:putative quinol monooxygenase [Desulforhopalus singaporensis]|uniref:Quinol monooxygenase YgiN n=1 Tax=Desulforhopalus singaporensis TaxID=91360 RepID=A0A1H0VZC5_9BACT|nr:antibiotic biosynthesis monooxygenase [Desulforhopalus singaporensis]SDP83784.1 Quinol monooxygenase YgiN [Desulforhopalus singaporensis]
MLIVITKIYVPPRNQKEILQTLYSLLDLNRKEGGCLNYNIYQEIGCENHYCLIERWSSLKQWDTYFGSDRFKVFMGAMSFLDRTPQITFGTVSSEKKAESLMKRIQEMQPGSDSNGD